MSTPDTNGAAITNADGAASPARSTRPLPGSRDARRMAALILETLGGLRTAQEASEAMGVALVRYYVLEERALEAMIGAMEPRPRGRQRSPDAEIERLRGEVARLEREVLRYQALHRATQRAIGLADKRNKLLGDGPAGGLGWGGALEGRARAGVSRLARACGAACLGSMWAWAGGLGALRAERGSTASLETWVAAMVKARSEVHVRPLG